MSKFFDKLEALSKALANFNASIKQPKMASVKPPQQPKLPGQPSGSKKDPVKMAEQLKNPDLKPLAVDQASTMKETLKVSKNGQWSL